jgi:hypothetical protein
LLNVGSLETGLLEANEIHSWPFVVTTTTVITINVASAIELDVGITVRDSAGNTIAEQNSAQNGQAEILAGVLLPVADTYQILITAPPDTAGNYAILVNDDNSYTFVFQGTLNYGDSAGGTLLPMNDHFWNFDGTAGDEIVITTTPSDGSADLFLRFFGADGVSLIRFHDEGQTGETEILTFTLPATGFYSLLVGEIEANAASYTIELALG